jgi:hypothetical protein
MVFSLSFLTTITSIVSRKVKLSNGSFAEVTHISTVKINATLILTNVLCVPSFSFNLISVSKLITLLHCCLIFIAEFCFIQQLLGWKMIELGKGMLACIILCCMTWQVYVTLVFLCQKLCLISILLFQIWMFPILL